MPDGAKPLSETSVDLSSVRSSDINLRAISQSITLPSITKIRLKITYLKLKWNLPGANELNKMFLNLMSVGLHSGPGIYGLIS